MKTEFRDLADPTGVNEAVAGAQVPMGYYLRVVQVNHALQDIGDQRGNEHVIQMEILVGQHIFQAASGTVSGEYDHRSVVSGGPNEVDDVLMADLLFIFYKR